MLYFAYGSNLDTARMARRCPRAAVVGPAVLPDHRVAFVGRSRAWDAAVATITPADGDLHGLLYALDDDDLACLDRFEGAPRWYRRERRELLHDGAPTPAWVYALPASVPPAAPHPDYVRLILHGLDALGANTDALLDASWTVNAPPDQRHRVFVYGSLLRGEPNAHNLDGAAWLGMARTEDRYGLVDLGAYPGLVDGDGAVLGEVYAVDDGTLARLDRFEDVPRLYERVSVTLRGGRAAMTYRYVGAHRGDHVSCCDWRWWKRSAAIRAR